MRSWHQMSSAESHFISTRGLCPGSSRFLQTAGGPESLEHTCVGIKRPERRFSSTEVKLILHTLVVSLNGSAGRRRCLSCFNWKRSHGKEQCVHVKLRSGVCPGTEDLISRRLFRSQWPLLQNIITQKLVWLNFIRNYDCLCRCLFSLTPGVT